MSNRVIMSFSICLLNLGLMNAQGIEKDTIWIDNGQMDKQKICLNEETMRAIQSGTLINFDSPKPVTKPRPYRMKIAITKDFGLKPVAGLPMEITDTLHIPPSVFAKLKFSFLPVKEVTGFKVSSKSDELRATPAGFAFSAEDLLQSIFSKTARAKKHNRKHATAWKTYNNFP